MAVTLYLIRHGLTQGNLEGRYIGQRENPPLSDRGRRELTERKETHPYPRAEALYTSPLLRCLQTAQILYPMLVPVPLPSLGGFGRPAAATWRRKRPGIDRPVGGGAQKNSR